VIIRRGYSVPENITMFYAGAGALGSVYPLILAHTGGHGLECPLRALTGVPCPFCGLPTATVALTHGHWATAAATSPLAYLVAALTLSTAPILVARNAGLVAQPRAWSPAARQRAGCVVAVVVALSWLFQLHRYGFL
jgi:glycerol-3-phosphate acyltransferase PlsY